MTPQQPAHEAAGALDLSYARALHVQLCTCDATKRDRYGDPLPCGIGYGAISAGVWLVFHGWDGPACEAEQATEWSADRYRLFLATLDTDGKVRDELEAGYCVLFGVARPRRVRPRNRADFQIDERRAA